MITPGLHPPGPDYGTRRERVRSHGVECRVSEQLAFLAQHPDFEVGDGADDPPEPGDGLDLSMINPR